MTQYPSTPQPQYVREYYSTSTLLRKLSKSFLRLVLLMWSSPEWVSLDPSHSSLIPDAYAKRYLVVKAPKELPETSAADVEQARVRLL